LTETVVEVVDFVLVSFFIYLQVSKKNVNKDAIKSSSDDVTVIKTGDGKLN